MQFLGKDLTPEESAKGFVNPFRTGLCARQNSPGLGPEDSLLQSLRRIESQPEIGQIEKNNGNQPAGKKRMWCRLSVLNLPVQLAIA